MVVIAGKYKGLKLKTLQDMHTRPTSARVKEDLFNMLSNYFIYENKVSLDLFGGTGALSIEGLSRGVKFAYINDNYLPAVKIIEQNLTRVEQTDYQLTKKDYADLIDELVSKKIKVDLVYLDPPFPKIEYYYDFFALLDKISLLNNWAMVVVEAPEPLDLTKIKQLTLLKEKIYRTKVHKYLYLFRLELGEK